MVFCLFGVSSIKAQVEHRCGFVEAIDGLDKEFPGVKKEIEQDYLESVQMSKISSSRRSKYDTVYSLQVVFHVLWNTNAENLHDSLILSQLDILNEDFRRRNADTGNTREIFKSVAGDARIEFELATKDPSGNPTDGINRVYSNNNTFYDNQRSDMMKYSSRGGVDAWDSKRYLNIWVCDYSIPSLGPAILGFAYPPSGARNWTNQTSNIPDARQGVVLHYQIVGRTNPTANSQTLRYAVGRSATHEVGHYLGLRHTWGDGSNATGCGLDDFIEDTPNERTQNGFTASCAGNRNTCTDSQNDLPDMTENYMDYSRNICQNMFTNQQIAIMRYNLVKLRPGMAVNPKLELDPNYQSLDSDFAILTHLQSDHFLVHIANETNDSKSIKIRNSVGQIVSELDDLGKLENQLIDVSTLASGMYFVTVYNIDGSEINMGKFFKK